MGLGEYERKRHFEGTPEPPPRLSVEEERRFCVQRHDASRLHYDFRLEAGGVLKSWAVPRGPTLDPGEKRMAAHVEDHPVDYLTFEGVIPEGNYGAGSVMLWDLGHYDLLGEGSFEEQYERGNLKFRLHGTRLGGTFALVRMKGGRDWLLIKKRDDSAVPGWDIEQFSTSVQTHLTQAELTRGMAGREWSSTEGLKPESASQGPSRPASPGPPSRGTPAPFPELCPPMQAVLGAAPFDAPDWLFELKWDGIRAVAYHDDATHDTRLLSRRGLTLLPQFPELGALRLNMRADSFVLDGEIVALDEAGRPDFQRLQPRMHASAAAGLRLSRKTPVVYYVFDLLYLDGHDLRAVPCTQRKRLLTERLVADALVRLSEATPGLGSHLFSFAREHGLEGIVAKRSQSRYEGTRSRDWVKIKTVQSVDCIVCGMTEPRGSRERFGALVLGMYRGSDLVGVGQVGTGFDAGLLAQIEQMLLPLEGPSAPFTRRTRVKEKVRWVRPEVVCEVKYSNWTRDGHLRHPTFLGLRPDKTPVECRIDEAIEVTGPPGTARAEATSQGDASSRRASAGAVGEAGGGAVAGAPLAQEGVQDQIVRLDGRAFRLSHLEKVLFPEDGFTKRDLINYYDAMASVVLPYLEGRPLTLKRYPDGIHGPHFFQRHVDAKFPSWLPRVRLESLEGEMEDLVLCHDRATLVYLANLACIDQNVTLSRVESPDEPDFMLLDLDPQECPFDLVVEAVRVTKGILDEIGLQGYPKTSGARGFHIWVPLAPGHTFEQTRTLAQVIAVLAGARRPGLFTFPRSLDKREKGKVYFDHPHNRRASTIASPYVLRAFRGAPASAPLHWDEVRPGLDPGRFNLRSMRARVAEVGDLFAPALSQTQHLEPAIVKLDKLVKR